MNYAILLLFFGFVNKLWSPKTTSLFSKKEDYFFPKEIQDMISKYEQMYSDTNVKFQVIKEENIIEDSFEGFLRRHYFLITPPKNNEIEKLDFPKFLLWRKQIGTLHYESEIETIYNETVKDHDNCSLLEFIAINKKIDENDGAK